MTRAAFRCARPILGVGMTAGFLWLLAREVNRADVTTALTRMSPSSLVMAVVFLATGYACRIIRWWWMLRSFDPAIRLSTCVWPFLLSMSLNNVLPLRAGDAVRVIGFRRHLRAPGMRLLGTMVIERVLDLMTLLALFFVGLGGVLPGRVPQTLVSVALVVGGAAVVAVATLIVCARQLRGLLDRLSGHHAIASRRSLHAAVGHARHLVGSLEILSSPVLGVQLIAWSLAVWLFEGAVFATIGRDLVVPTSTFGPWFALATGTLATILPSSPGYVGTFDYFAVLGLVAYGTPREVALAFAVVVHLVLWLPVTAAGLVYFVRPGGRRSLDEATGAMHLSEEQL